MSWNLMSGFQDNSLQVWHLVHLAHYIWCMDKSMFFLHMSYAIVLYHLDMDIYFQINPLVIEMHIECGRLSIVDVEGISHTSFLSKSDIMYTWEE